MNFRQKDRRLADVVIDLTDTAATTTTDQRNKFADLNT